MDMRPDDDDDDGPARSLPDWRPDRLRFDRVRRPPWMTPRVIRLAALALAALVVLANVAYQVQAEEMGIVLRFGRYVRTSEPGLHVKVPFIEAVQRVPVQRQLKEEFGFRTVQAAARSQYRRRASTRSR